MIRSLIWMVACMVIMSGGTFIGHCADEFDSFPKKITLESDKSSYHAGDPVILTVTLFYEGGYKMRLYKDLAKSASLSVGRWEGNIYFPNLCSPTLKELNVSRVERTFQAEPVEEISSDSAQIIKRELKGRVELAGDKIRVLFDGFGSFELDGPVELDISLHFWPVNPSPFSSFEDKTNVVKLFFDK